MKTPSIYFCVLVVFGFAALGSVGSPSRAQEGSDKQAPDYRPNTRSGHDHTAILELGAQAPDFCLPGVDNRQHCLKDFAAHKILMVVFTCDHCPVAQFYEGRIKQLVADYRDNDVAIVAIQPNNPDSILLSEMGHTDVSDSLAEMKIRASFRKFNFPYLYDGENQRVSQAYGPTATPHVFIFDAERKLRYQGRIDNNPRPELVTSQDARNAIDALLADKPVTLAKTPAVGCSTKWAFKREDKLRELQRIEHEPVAVKLVSVDDLKDLRKNSSGNLLLVDFWATWCGPCREEMAELETTYRMYRRRPFDLVTVSINYPDEKAGVVSDLEAQHASSTNLLFGSSDIYALMAAFDKDWDGAVPYILLIRPNGEVVYKQSGASFDPIELRRRVLANLPDDRYVGNSAYWKTP